MNKPTNDTRRESLVTEWEAVNAQLRRLKARSTQLHQLLIELKNSAQNDPCAKPPASLKKPAATSSSKSRSSKPLSSEDLMQGVSD